MRAMTPWRRGPALFAILLLVSWGCAPPETETADAYVPGAGEDWRTCHPADAGFDPVALTSAVDWALEHETTMPTDPGQYLRDRFAGQPHQEIVGPTKLRGGVNGVLLHDGCIVAEWGDTRRADMTFSVTKSYLSTVVGLAERVLGLIWITQISSGLSAACSGSATKLRTGGFCE